MFSAPKIGWLLRESGRGRIGGRLRRHGRLLADLATDRRRAPRLTEAGNASRTLLYDVVDLVWSAALLEIFDVPAAVLPQVQHSDGDFGRCHSVAGVPDGTPIVAVLADSHAALFGQGCTTVGSAKATYGTGTSVMTPTAAFVPGFSPVPSTLAWLTDTPLYAREGNILASGATVAWAARLLGTDVSTLLSLAASVAGRR